MHQIPNVTYLGPESSWLKENAELGMRFHYKDKLHPVEEGYEKLETSQPSKLATVNSNCRGICHRR